MDKVIKVLQRAKASKNVTEKDVLIDKALALLAPSLSWAENDVLAILAGLGARPGMMRPVAGLLHAWDAKGTNVQFTDALRGLIAKGLLEANPQETDVALTEAGYAHISN